MVTCPVKITIAWPFSESKIILADCTIENTSESDMNLTRFEINLEKGLLSRNQNGDSFYLKSKQKCSKVFEIVKEDDKYFTEGVHKIESVLKIFYLPNYIFEQIRPSLSYSANLLNFK